MVDGVAEAQDGVNTFEESKIENIKDGPASDKFSSVDSFMDSLDPQKGPPSYVTERAPKIKSGLIQTPIERDKIQFSTPVDNPSASNPVVSEKPTSNLMKMIENRRASLPTKELGIKK